MRVTFVVPNAYGMGGTANAVVTQATALAGRVDVEILSLTHPQDAHYRLDPQVRLTDLPAGDEALRGRPPTRIPEGTDPGIDAALEAALERVLPGLDTDVLVTTSPALLAYAVQLAPSRVAVVHQEHRASSQRVSSLDLLLDVAPRADVVAMLTEPMAAWLAERLGPATPEVVVVPNALPPGFRPRSLLTEPVILSAGRLAAEKQWPQLVEAFALVADRIPAWRLRIFGTGPARAAIRETARAHGLWDRVELPGATRDLVSEWARAGLMVLASPSEGFPLVIPEAMAAGVPVVSYDTATGPRDQVRHGVDGLLVSPGSQTGLASALVRLAQDDDLRRRMGASALERSTTWSSAAITATWLDVYAQAVARKRDGVRPVPPAAAAPAPPAPPDAGAVLHALVDRLVAAVGPAHRSSPRIVLPMEARTAFLEALAAEAPAWVTLIDPALRGWPGRRGTVADMVPRLLPGRTARVVLEAGADSVTVELWETDPDGVLSDPAL